MPQHRKQEAQEDEHTRPFVQAKLPRTLQQGHEGFARRLMRQTRHHLEDELFWAMINSE